MLIVIALFLLIGIILVSPFCHGCRSNFFISVVQPENACFFGPKSIAPFEYSMQEIGKPPKVSEKSLRRLRIGNFKHPLFMASSTKDRVWVINYWRYLAVSEFGQNENRFRMRFHQWPVVQRRSGSTFGIRQHEILIIILTIWYNGGCQDESGVPVLSEYT